MFRTTCVRQNNMREKETPLFWIVKMSVARFFVKPSNYKRLAVDSDSSSDATEEPSGMYYLLSHNSKCFASFHKRRSRICFERNLSVTMLLFIYFTVDSVPMSSMEDTGLGLGAVSHEAVVSAVVAVTLPIRTTYRKYSPRDRYIIGKYANETGSTGGCEQIQIKVSEPKRKCCSRIPEEIIGSVKVCIKEQQISTEKYLTVATWAPSTPGSKNRWGC